jgi:cell division protein FtsB
MKIKTLLSLAALAALGLLASCGGKGTPQAAEEEAAEEVLQLETQAAELDSTAQVIEADIDALKEALDALEVDEE